MAESIDTTGVGMINANCEECAKQCRVYSSHDIEPGDHVVLNRIMYDHHAIVIKKLKEKDTFRVIEATNTVSGLSSGMSLIPKRKATIMSSEEKFDFINSRICVVRYKRRYSKEETIKRAIKLSSDCEFKCNYKYNFFENNCEHFASYCATGVHTSIQVRRLKTALRDVVTGNISEFDYLTKKLNDGLICESCFEDIKSVMEVRSTPVEKKNSIEKGDIIRYNYWWLPHQAVVLEIETRNNSEVECLIAHYAFCGLFRRTIKEERLVIELNGQFRKLQYTPAEFDVYEPCEVVRRARSRLGEQKFNPWTNNSSTFTRWCKLKNW